MKETGFKTKGASLNELGLGKVLTSHWNLSPAELVEETLRKKQGILNDTGALCIDTGEFTGRAPKDKFTVCDDKTEKTVWWGDVNFKFSSEKFDKLYARVAEYFSGKEVYVRDAYACADPQHRINIRVIAEHPWSNMFAYNMFLRPAKAELENFQYEWTILCAPGFRANPAVDGTRQHNFSIINFTKKIILIGGSGYTGEIKKGIFTILNYILPHERNVLSMHCSANIGNDGDTAVFFGLSGTGKTTLSADPNRKLIGDDEHGWSENSVFNFEGGCYAKCIRLSEEQEPQIFRAVKFGAILENINFHEGTRTVDYCNDKKTENTRVSYPLHYIDNAAISAIGRSPKNIFFLTCDAYGVIPPISKLTPAQAMYHFISGYTAKVAGTEMGITEPQLTFSACFGKAFLPLHPTRYAELLGKKLTGQKVNVWLVNTGWVGGGFGVGNRIKLSYTRALITAALNGELEKVKYQTIPVFGLSVPASCKGVPAEILVPKNSWKDKDAYDNQLNFLAESFVKNFDKYAEFANEEILAAAPKPVAVNA